MMSDDGFAELAARSEKVRNENRLLLDGLKSFERKLVELVGGLNCTGASEYVTFEEFFDHEDEIIGHTFGILFFDGKELWVNYVEEPHPGYEKSRWEYKPIEKIGIDWQRKVSDQKVRDSLIANLLISLDAEFEKTAPVVQSLSQFMTIEKAEIDSDLDQLFSHNSKLLDSWVKARKSVETDPELSITRSCSHVETVLKGCLKSLGETGYQKDAIEKLGSKVLDILKKSSVIDEATSQMMRGVGTFFLGIGTIRNAQSASHGKDEEYVPPTSDLAQTVNHLAGVASVFVMKQTNIYLKNN
ncbi:MULTISPECIES: abortive infection family protein [Pseudomonas syringae group]|uniref:abortive infection family protein n=1 Tax=Pseudomonas syringae group TaxID=136849 RepID=UPI0013DD9B07|nr:MULTISPECIES: abortive infection family protein [Pseudomonas syringae group]MCK9715184.1 abortive infection family protein [Pseudomonas syringae pv. syringae]MCK9764269.1 abortive infection family protein [Pseudomonas syringae pv. syringae]